jgi:hypothetical protein
MTPAWVLTTIFLRVWLVGLLLLSFLSVSDFVFRRPHRISLLGKRLVVGLVWPLALLSAAGRRTLLASFVGSKREETDYAVHTGREPKRLRDPHR